MVSPNPVLGGPVPPPRLRSLCDGVALAAVQISHRVDVLWNDLAAAQRRPLPQLLSERLDIQPTPRTVRGRHVAAAVDDTSSEAVDDRKGPGR